MYKDVLQTLNNDRKVDKNFIERLEKNGFEIELGKYDYHHKVSMFHLKV